MRKCSIGLDGFRTLIVALALGCAMSGCSVNSHWPGGQTPLVRPEAEELIPPYPRASFRDVLIRQNVDEPYTECVVYATKDAPGDVLSYYQRVLDAFGWAYYEVPAESSLGGSIYTTSGTAETVTTSDNVARRIGPSPDGTLHVYVMPGEPPGSQTITVCSKSFRTAAARPRTPG